jgi:aspartate aminotransferase
MPKISKKGHEMPASPIRKLVPFSEEAMKKGRKVYHLNIGQPDIKTPEAALNAIRNVSEKVIQYSHSAGNESYRKKLAGHYQKYGVDVDHNEILITTGGSEALIFAFMSTVDPGDEILITEPFYANYNAFAIMAGAKLVPITATIDNGFALPPLEKFEELINEKTKGILLCNPNNPTGYLYKEDEIRKLGEIVKKHDLYLYSDEVYREFCYDGEPYFSVMYMSDILQHIIMVDSVSKRYSSCGTRIGALVSKNKDVIATALKFAQARLSPPSFGQIAGEASLDTPKEYVEEVYKEYIERRNYMVAALNKMEGVYSPMPNGAFYTVVKLPVDSSEKFCKWILSEFEYNNQTVMMAPASGFYATPGLGYNEVRIAYVLKIDDLKNAMITLEKALLAYPGRTL